MANAITTQTTFEIKLPKVLIDILARYRLAKRAKVATEVTTRLVLDMVRNAEISIGQGAELLNVNLEDLLDLMARHNIAYFNYSYKDIQKDLATLKSL